MNSREETSPPKPVGLGIFFIVVSAIGILAAFALTVEKLHALAHPGTAAACDFSVLVQCGKNLGSWQGSLLGFPNPLLGLIGWPVVMATGAGLLARARYSNWYWRSFSVVAAAAFVFTIWLFFESVFQLGTLCPWCMVTWVATISLLVVTKAWLLKHGVWGTREWTLRLGDATLRWSPAIILGILLIEALIAQVRLDWIHNL